MFRKNINLKNKNDYFVIKLIMLSIFLLFAVTPLLNLLLNINADNFRNVITSVNFNEVILNSLFSTTVSTIISVSIAYALAVLTERTNLKHKKVFRVIFTLPMLIPSISHGMGLIILLGNNGILTNLLNLNSGIYGLKGIVVGSILYSFPVAYLMFADVMKYEDSTAYEAAEILGVPRIKQFKDITLPYLKKPLISIVFCIFSLIITDYGVPLMVGGKYKTLSLVMYQEVIGQLNFGKGAVYGLFLLIPAFIAFVLDFISKKQNNGNNTIIREFNFDKGNNKLSFILCSIFSLIISLPLFSFIIIAFVAKYPSDLNFTFANFSNALNYNAGKYLLNSIFIALCTATVGVTIAFIVAYLSSRLKGNKTQWLHLLALLTAAIPGMALGLSYVLTFKNSFIYGTFVILIIVNMIHFISSPYMMMYNSLSKINGNLETVGEIMGINRYHMIKDIFIPMCKSTLLEMFTYYFVNCMMTISAVSFLSNSTTRPASLLISQFEAQMQLEYAAVVSLLIFAINLVMKYLMRKKHI